MSTIASIPIKPQTANGNSTLINTHIDIHVDYHKADQRGGAGVKMTLYPVRRENGFATHSISFGMASFPRTLVQAMDKNFKAKVQAVRDRVREEFEQQIGDWYDHAIRMIHEKGYELLEPTMAEALAMVDDDRR